jgi:NAD(P)-dependent dehydrogenase (short-subunit alcohol dehydrogenase family)
MSAYSPSKAALNQFTRILATELGGYGIRVNAVPAGMTDTEMAAGVIANPELVAAIESATPLGRFGKPLDVAKVICFCASDEADWMTGQVVDATGGYHLAQ